MDNFIYAGSEHFEDIIVNNVLHNVDVKTMDATDFTYVGLEIKQLEDKSITVSQNKHIQRELHEIPISLKRKGQKNHALSPTEYKQYRSVCAQLLWLSVQTRPDISFDTCMLQNHLNDPNVADVLYANKVIKKLKLDNDYVSHFKGFQDGRSLKIVCYVTLPTIICPRMAVNRDLSYSCAILKRLSKILLLGDPHDMIVYVRAVWLLNVWDYKRPSTMQYSYKRLLASR